MEHEIIGKRIKELRISKGYSQEHLAEEVKLDLRTIQRLENGATTPRGDTLIRLASVFEVGPEELLAWSKHEDKDQLLLLNLSGLSIVLNPFFGVIIPMAIWVAKRNKIVNADEYGKRLINFQISWLLLLSFFLIAYFVYVVGFLEMDKTGAINSPIAALILIFGLGFYYTYSLILIVVNTIRIQKNVPVKYGPSLKIIR